MSWEAPRTWVAGEVVTAAQMNQHVRDNLSALAATRARVDTSETTTSTSFTDLATSGPAVTVAIGAAGTALCIIQCQASNNTTDTACVVSVAVSGATTVAADDLRSLVLTSSATGTNYASAAVFKFTGLTAGSNTFTMKYRVAGGTGTFQRREINVIGV